VRRCDVESRSNQNALNTGKTSASARFKGLVLIVNHEASTKTPAIVIRSTAA
jgi:hypothetical protein